MINVSCKEIWFKKKNGKRFIVEKVELFTVTLRELSLEKASPPEGTLHKIDKTMLEILYEPWRKHRSLEEPWGPSCDEPGIPKLFDGDDSETGKDAHS